MEGVINIKNLTKDLKKKKNQQESFKLIQGKIFVENKNYKVSNEFTLEFNSKNYKQSAILC